MRDALSQFANAARQRAAGATMLKGAPSKREVIDLDPDEEAPAGKKAKVEPKVEPKPEPEPEPKPALAASTMSPVAIRRLTKEVRDFRRRNADGVLLTRAELGLEFELVDPDRLDVWEAKWFYDMADDKDATETQKALAKQLKHRRETYDQDRDLDHIKFRMVFPDNYPEGAPFVYNHYPRLKGHFIFSQGGLCAQTLSTKFGWSCASKAQSLMATVRSLLENVEPVGCRLQSLETGDCGGRVKTLLTPFDEAGARKDFNTITKLHDRGWHGSAGRS